MRNFSSHKGEIIPLPDDYKFVKYAPYFMIEIGRSVNDKVVGVMFESNRPHTDIKTWVIEQFNSNEILKGRRLKK